MSVPEKDPLLKTNLYDIVFCWIVHLIKNIFYCVFGFRNLVDNKTYVINLLSC